MNKMDKEALKFVVTYIGIVVLLVIALAGIGSMIIPSKFEQRRAMYEECMESEEFSHDDCIALAGER